jgi:predicted ATP-binding protein involved in virulence
MGLTKGIVDMKIQHLKLQNFRGIKDLELPIHEQLTLLVGINGAGKTAILEALAIMLSWVVSRVRHAGTSGRNIQELDINNLANFALLRVVTRQAFSWQLVKTKKGRVKPPEVSKLQQISDYAKSLQEQISRSSETCSIPVLVFYPTNRAVLKIPLRIRNSQSFTLLETYDDALTSGANFRHFFEWCRNREDLENEELKYKNSPQPDKQLEAVRGALDQFLPDFKNLAVRRKPLRMTVTKQGSEIQIEQLSDGEKCLMAMIGDLARRLAIANPTLANPLTGEGIVLIDELDLHLHPVWQRPSMAKFTTVFPNCQFIVSTHSPQALGEVRGDCIRLLHPDENHNIQCHIPRQALGLDSVEILEELMYAPIRNLETDADLKAIFKWIDAGKFTVAKSAIAALTTKLEGSIPEIVRAESLMTMLEMEETN